VADVEIVDQTFRDGQQSLWGMRLRGGMLRKVAGDLENSGFRAVEVTGSSLMECSVRYNREDPWQSLDHWRAWMPTSELRSPVCQNRIGTFGMTPDALMDVWVRTLVKHGIDALWVYDCLYNMEQMHRLCDVIRDSGARALGAIMYGISPVHTDEWFASRVAEMASWDSVSAIYVEDAPGILTPQRARTLVPALLRAAGDKPVEWHFHNNTALGAMNYAIAVEEGGRILHTCSRPLANGPSLPSTEQTVANLRHRGHTTGIDESRLPPVAAHCERIAAQEGWAVGEPAEHDVFAYQHHLPGGMTGTLKAQLAQYGMTERLPEVLDETVRVREELGHPISATPFSQLVGIQSVLNIVTGDRWSVVPDEVVIYLKDEFGVPPAPVDENVRDRVLSSPNGLRYEGWTRPQPSLEEIRESYGGAGVSDEELLLRYMVPAEDVAAARANPVMADYPYLDETTELDLVHRLMDAKRAKYVHVRRGTNEITMRKA
jgi:oxaloacetate decarboxylase (Na+ extruding) subunit alpha